ncbi:MAG: metal ABC transporter ATP-binding protein [Patescibacteria group bacterium]
MFKILETKNISVRYNQSEVVKDVSFAIVKGDFVGLAGPNGAGKTTLVKAILGLTPITSGSVKLFEEKKEKFNDWSKIGYLPQKSSTINPLFPATVNEVVMLGLLSQKKWPKRIIKKDQVKIDEVLHELGISNLKKRMFFELSGGQQQKVLLARALVSGPELLIFDEPSTALDPESRESFFQLLERLNKKNGIAIILITHDTGYIGKYANKLLYIDKHLIYFGKFSEFCESEKMKSYFGKYEQHLICHQHD